ncbi:Signal recognition particle receptor subunit alpha, partial [Paragonimus heterotremus]
IASDQRYTVEAVNSFLFFCVESPVPGSARLGCSSEMLDFFVILSKGGIRLWCFPSTADIFRISINTFLKSLILKENAGQSPFIHDSRAIRLHMDNEFNLLFIAAYQKILQLTYVDKFLTAIALEFRDKYKNKLQCNEIMCNFDDFNIVYSETLKRIEIEDRALRTGAKPMRTFVESEKSKKTVASMIVSRNKRPSERAVNEKKSHVKTELPVVVQQQPTSTTVDEQVNEDVFAQNRRKLAEKLKMTKKSKESVSPTASPLQKPNGKRVKESRRWDNAATGEEAAALDFSATSHGQSGVDPKNGSGYVLSSSEAATLSSLRGTMGDDLDEVQVSSDDDLEVDTVSDNESDCTLEAPKAATVSHQNGFLKDNRGNSGLVSSLLRGLRITGGSGRVLSHEDIQLSLEQLRDRLVAKNVAVEIAQRVCDSVAEQLVGTSLSAFERVYPRVRSALEEVCTRVLASGRRVDVLRDALDARTQGRPYTIVFCGVNGVGKSTNLAKIAFWLIEKQFRVLIAACDTFRSGAVEQLRTHVHKLNYIHPPEQHGGQTMVELYEQGYGRDAASIARSAINHARARHLDVVLVDTAGRMQDNEPLMRALASVSVIN